MVESKTKLLEQTQVLPLWVNVDGQTQEAPVLEGIKGAWQVEHMLFCWHCVQKFIVQVKQFVWNKVVPDGQTQALLSTV